MNKKAITALGTIIAVALAASVAIAVFHPKSAAAGEVSEAVTIMEITAAAEVDVAAPVLPTAPVLNGDAVTTLAKSDGKDSITVTPTGDDTCHVDVPDGTTVSTLRSIGLSAEKWGCKAGIWWSTVDIPLVGDKSVAK